jgi:hypothetical protein
METPVVEPSTFNVIIAYNGTPEHERVNPHELVGTVLKRALVLFRIRDRQHVYALFREKGPAVPDDVTVHAAGIEPGTELFLREKQVQGG